MEETTLALLPTGGGKVFVSRFPALGKRRSLHCCIAIDCFDERPNWRTCRKKKFRPLLFTPACRSTGKDILQLAVNEKLKFLYVSPERLTTKLFFLNICPEMNVSLIAWMRHIVSVSGVMIFVRLIWKSLPWEKNYRTFLFLAVTAPTLPLFRMIFVRNFQFRNHPYL